MTKENDTLPPEYKKRLEATGQYLKAAICLDTWKLKFFTDVLDREGFDYKKKPGITADTLTLQVKTKSAEALAPFVQEANDAAARSRLN